MADGGGGARRAAGIHRSTLEGEYPAPDFVKIHETDKSRFYPASPISLSNIASLDALNARLEAPIPMNRFRMNIVVDGLDAWEGERIDTMCSPSMEIEGITPAE